MIPMILEIFLLFYSGNEVMLAAENFLMDIFHAEWYHGSKKFRKNFSILLTQASQPLIMVTALIFQVTLENFMTVMKVSYQYYAVMQKMNVH